MASKLKSVASRAKPPSAKPLLQERLAAEVESYVRSLEEALAREAWLRSSGWRSGDNGWWSLDGIHWVNSDTARRTQGEWDALRSARSDRDER